VGCAYGAGVLCANGLGMVEAPFTLPAFRKRGSATAIIARTITPVRQQGATQILLGAHATEPPKWLYAALGFAPVRVTRAYIKHIDRSAVDSCAAWSCCPKLWIGTSVGVALTCEEGGMDNRPFVR
jgi:hypothetical protein